MKHIISFLLLLCHLPAIAGNNAAFYMQRLASRDTDLEAKLQCIDSLVALNVPEIDSLQFVKLDIAVETGKNDMALRTYKSLRDANKTFPINKECDLRFKHIRVLISGKMYYECLNECIDLLDLNKPDSLIYYNAYANEILDEFTHYMKIELGVDYLSETSRLIEYAEKEKLPPVVLNKLLRVFHNQKLMQSIYEQDYESALKEVTALEKIPASRQQRAQLDANIAYIYMQIGKPDLAESCFQRLLSEKEWFYPHAVALMNYTHLLNSQGKYEETLDMLGKHDEAYSILEGDLYQTFLISNKAIAEFNSGRHAPGFNDMVFAKQLTDSLFLKSKYQTGLLAHQLYSKQKEIDFSAPKIRRMGKLIWIMATLIVILSAAILFIYIQWRTTRHRFADISAKYDSLNTLYDKHMENKQQKLQEDNGKIAAEILQLGAIQESFSSIEAALSNKRKSAVEKIEIISSIMDNTNKNTSARDLFERQFEQAHAPFFKNLYEAHPDLSPSEARMCAYLIMNLSSKEIASISNKTIRSVESTRYRLYKKFNLPEGQSVITYLRQYIK